MSPPSTYWIVKWNDPAWSLPYFSYNESSPWSDRRSDARRFYSRKEASSVCRHWRSESNGKLARVVRVVPKLRAEARHDQPVGHKMSLEAVEKRAASDMLLVTNEVRRLRLALRQVIEASSEEERKKFDLERTFDHVARYRMQRIAAIALENS
jgi:hypothetical protein